MINFDEILKGLTLILTNAVATLPQKEKDLAMNYLAGLKARIEFDINQLASEQNSLNAVISRLEQEPQIIIAQVESLGIVAGANIEDAVNHAIDLLIASIPTVTVEGETVAAFPQSTYSKAVGVSPNTIPDSKLTTYGVFIAGELSPGDAITVAKKLGATAIRMGINIDQWAGRNTGFEQFKQNGFKVYLNVNYYTIRAEIKGQRTAQPFVPANEMDKYKAQLREILTVCRPDYLMIENEETADIFHSGSAYEYLNQLSAASEVARSMGIPISNGGLTNPGLQMCTYRWLVTNNQTVAANDFYNNCMDSRTKKAAKYRGTNKDMDAKADETAYLLSNYGKLIDFVNFHWYEPLLKYSYGIFKNNTSDVTPGALKQVSSYIRAMTGLDAISNEVGITNENEKLVTSVLKDFAANNIKTLVWFSATSENGTTDPLNDGTDLNSLGNAFAKFVK